MFTKAEQVSAKKPPPVVPEEVTSQRLRRALSERDVVALEDVDAHLAVDDLEEDALEGDRDAVGAGWVGDDLGVVIDRVGQITRIDVAVGEDDGSRVAGKVKRCANGAERCRVGLAGSACRPDEGEIRAVAERLKDEKVGGRRAERARADDDDFNVVALAGRVARRDGGGATRLFQPFPKTVAMPFWSVTAEDEFNETMLIFELEKLSVVPTTGVPLAAVTENSIAPDSSLKLPMVIGSLSASNRRDGFNRRAAAKSRQGRTNESAFGTRRGHVRVETEVVLSCPTCAGCCPWSCPRDRVTSDAAPPISRVGTVRHARTVTGVVIGGHGSPRC